MTYPASFHPAWLRAKSLRALATFALVLLTCCAALCLAGCSNQSPSQSSNQSATAGYDAASPNGSAASSSSAAAGKSSKAATVMGERLTTRQIVDHQQQNLVVGVVAVPASWKFSSSVVWNYGNSSNPVRVSMAAENPANAEAVYSYPPELFFYLRPAARYTPGQNYGGLIFSYSQPPVAALTGFIRQVRANVRNLRFVGSKELPGLAAALQIPKSPNQHGVGIKVTYDLDGKPVEEEFYSVYDSIEIPYDGPRGRTYQDNWGLEALHSFRAPAGTLDQRRPVFAAVAKSFRPNPAWQKRHAAINSYLAQEFNRQLRAGYDQIAAAARLSQQLTANSNAFLAGVDQQLQASRNSGGSSGAAADRSSADKFDDYIRGVDTVDDPEYGTTQLSNSEQYHWTDGYGTYRNSNDANYDPNQTEVGNWQLMKSAP